MHFKQVTLKILSVGCAFTLLLSCHKKENENTVEAKAFDVNVTQQGAEFSLPPDLWEHMLHDETAVKPEGGGGHAAPAGHGAPAAGHAAAGAQAESGMTVTHFIYAPIEVILKEKTPGVLREPLIRFKLPGGGSEIDLSRWTTGAVGSFYVQFEWLGTSSEVTQPKAYFYSRTRKRKVGDHVIGSGCKSYMDLTKTILAQTKESGLLVNTTRNFHSTVLGGHFLFSWMDGKTKKITRVSFTDSQNPSFFCENAQ